MVIFLLIHVN